MRLYLDTSALVTLYVSEAGSDEVREALDGAMIVATSAIAYVEAVSAFARRRREGALRAADYRTAKRALDRDWDHYVRVAVSDDLIRAAAQAAERHGVRAYGAVHLASALLLQEQLDAGITFLCWDEALTQAAGRSGLDARGV